MIILKNKKIVSIFIGKTDLFSFNIKKESILSNPYFNIAKILQQHHIAMDLEFTNCWISTYQHKVYLITFILNNL